LWFLGLVVEAGVESELAQQLAGGGVDHADVLVVDQDSNPFVFVGASDSDVVHAGAEPEGDGAGVIDTVFADSPVSVGAGRGGFAARGVGLVWGCAVEGAMRADGVVVVAEGVELALELNDRVG
jgi:hypothetical protein